MRIGVLLASGKIEGSSLLAASGVTRGCTYFEEASGEDGMQVVIGERHVPFDSLNTIFD